MSTPKPCTFDRSVGYRATIGEHDDDCTDPTGHRGCVPCAHGHCGICNRVHTSDQHPQTCPECVSSVREDLTEIAGLCRLLRRQAVDAEGLAWASSRIPGANAMIAMGPTVELDKVRVNRDHTNVHRPRDMVPPLAVLAHWQDVWADWLDITPARPGLSDVERAADAQRATARASWLGLDLDTRASITRAAGFLDRQITRIAQQSPTAWRDGQVVSAPDFAECAFQLGKLRAQLEGLLHDESTDEHGVDCFECGAQLVRRIRDPKRCRHATPAHDLLKERLLERQDPADWERTVRSYGIPVWPEERDAARLPSPVEVAAARMPCHRCDQGGVADPRPGISWECPACRKRYTPGEYATAVRRDLLDRNDGDGWTQINLAADAASTLTGQPVLAVTVRKWMDRGKVLSCCLLEFDHLGGSKECKDPVQHRGCRIWAKPNGPRLVFWPDVAEQAAASVERAKAAAIARAQKAVRDEARAVLEALDEEIPKPVERELLGMLPVTREGDLDVDALNVLVVLKLAQHEQPERAPEVRAS